MKFNASQFLISEFGDHNGARQACRDHGVEVPERATAYAWFMRGRLTGDWLAKLLVVVERRDGRPVSLAKYMT